MLHSNSRQAKQNIRAYIMDNFDGSGYEIKEPKTFQETALVILSTFRSEKFYSSSRMNEALLFEDWAQGLPSVLNTCYYYNRSAVDDLAAILEETDSEKSQYTEQQAEKRLTALIYRELKGAERK